MPPYQTSEFINFKKCCVCRYVYVCGQTIMCMWKSEDNFVELVLSFHLFVGPEIELRYQAFTVSKNLYPLSCLASPINFVFTL